MKQLIEAIHTKKQNKDIYIYGVGLYAQRVYQILLENGIDIAGFVVTSDKACNHNLFPLPIYKADEFDFSNVLIIIGTNRHNSIEIKKYLQNQTNCDGNSILISCEYLEHRETDENYYKMPTVEITTVIGCKVNCKYCPQKLLMNRYFENNLKRDSVMSMDTFRRCLQNLPNECNIQFCGMSEPFLNENCSEMIIEASKSGKHIELYTTLVGASIKKIEKIWNLPLEYVNIHIPDVERNADIPISDEYLQLLTEVVNHKKSDGAFWVNLCNAQGQPDAQVAAICQERLDISTILHDRAGNLDAPMLISKQNKSGALSCTLCGQQLNHNVVLPDGTVLLCCMDYGMKHIIGNLAEQTYEEIMQSKEVAQIKQGLCGDEGIDILCRNCSNASKL